MPEPIYIKLGMYIMVLELISTAYFKNPSHQSVCLNVYAPIGARQQLRKQVPTATNTHNNRSIVGCVIFYVVYVISKESVYAPTVARQRLGKHIPAAMNSCWRHCFLCSLHHIKRKQAINYSPKLPVSSVYHLQRIKEV
jgi:hypothetical protein